MQHIQTSVSKKLNIMTNLKYFTFCAYARNCLSLLLNALEIGEGDEVIIPAFTCQSIIQTIYDTGAIPVLVDVDNNSINISPDGIKKSLTKKTKMIYVIHAFGISAEIDKISAIARSNSLYLVEDISHALNCTYANKQLGSFGDFTIGSLTKTMINYQGGFIASNNYNIHKKIDWIRKKRNKKTKPHLKYYAYRLMCSLWECNGSLVACVVFKILLLIKGNKMLDKLYQNNTDFDYMSTMSLYLSNLQLSKQLSYRYKKRRNEKYRRFVSKKRINSVIFPIILPKQVGLLPNHHCGITPPGEITDFFQLKVWSNTSYSSNLKNSFCLFKNFRLFVKGL